MGLFSSVMDLSDEYLMLYGLVIATFLFWAVGGMGLGYGASFQGWAPFLNAIGIVLLLNIIIGFTSFILGLLGSELSLFIIAGIGGYLLYSLSHTGISDTLTSTVTDTPITYQLVIVLLVVLLLL